MSKILFGKDKILAVRKLVEASQKKGLKIGYQIEHTITYENATESTKTKDGAIGYNSGLEVSLELTAVATKDEINELLLDAVINGDTVEFWEIDLSTLDDQNQCDALYMRGHLESWEVPANVEEAVEISTSAIIDGVPQKGKVTLDETQIEAITYAFRDLEVVTDDEEAGPAA